MVVTIKAIKSLFLPPAINLLVVLFGFFLLKRSPKIAKSCIVLALVSLYIVSIAPVSSLLISNLEDIPPLPINITNQGEKAIVILGGGRYYSTPEYFTDTVTSSSLERLRYGALLKKKTGLPILVSGGRLDYETLSEADLMEHALNESFNTKTRWKEGKSLNTAENAIYTAQLLKRLNIDHIYLVTHAWHMKRAVMMFEQTGLIVTPAPTAYELSKSLQFSLKDIIPSSSDLSASNLALHEYLGLLWYTLRY